MLDIAIQLLWLLIGAIILCGVIYLVLYGIKEFIYAIPPRVEQGIWFIVFLLIVIAVLTLLAGGSMGGMRLPLHR